MLLTDAVQLVVGIRWSACAVQHAGQPARGARGGAWGAAWWLQGWRWSIVSSSPFSFSFGLAGDATLPLCGGTSLFRMCE